jgi:hypothetical protein
MNMPPRNISFLYIERYGGNKILCLKRDGLERISDKLIPFLRDILLSLSELLPPKDEEENNIINILNQPICLNINTKRNGNCLLLNKYCYNGVFFIDEIVSEDKQFLSYQEFQMHDKYKHSRILWYCVCSTKGMGTHIWETAFH